MVPKYAGNTYFLVRHGEARTNILNVVSASPGSLEYPLTDRGHKQIEQTAQFLKAYHSDFIVASPVLRAKQTAEILQIALHIPLSFDERLCEARVGAFEGKNIDSFFDFIDTHGGRVTGAPEVGIEGFMDIRERVQSFLASASQAFTGKKIVVVSHGDTLQELYGELLGDPVGANQTGGIHGWYPEKGSCVVIGEGIFQEFKPTV